MMQSIKVTLSLVAQCNCEFAHVIIPHDARRIVPLAVICKDYAVFHSIVVIGFTIFPVVIRRSAAIGPSKSTFDFCVAKADENIFTSGQCTDEFVFLSVVN